MADNVELDAGSGGAVIAGDEITGVVYQRVKLVHGIDGVNSGDIASTNPLPVTVSGVAGTVTVAGDIGISSVAGTVNVAGTVTANLGTISSIATQATLSEISTFASSTVSLASTIALRTLAVSSTTASSVSLLSTLALRLLSVSTATASTYNILVSSQASTGALWVQAVPGAAQTTISTTDLIRVAVYGTGDNQITSFGSGTQYVEGQTSTAPTGTVVLWKSAVSTLRAASSSDPLPVNVIAGSLNANTEYLEGNTTTLPTGIVSLWKSAVSTLTPASTSNPWPVQGFGNLSSLATQLSMGNVSTFTNSTNTLLVQVSSTTASTVSLASTIALRLAQTPNGIFTQPVGVSSRGLATFRTLDADETEEQISATPCALYGVWASNSAAVVNYLKFYNGTSSAIFVSSATPLITIALPAHTSTVAANFNVGGMGIDFSTACCVAAVSSAADGNVGDPGASTVIVNVFYKN